MSVPAATVKSLCTGAEVELVRASRKPELDKLSPAEVKRLADRARKLHDKWRDAKRDQARSKSRVAGVGKPGDNTQLKAQIFAEAREAFEGRLQKLAAKEAGAKPAAKTPAKSAPASQVAKTKKTKAQRAIDHRNRRAGVREGLAVTKDILNEPARKAKAAGNKAAAAKKPTTKPAAAPPAPTPAAAAPATAESAAPAQVAKPPRAKKTKVTKLHAPQGDRINAAQQLEAVTAAKHSRVVRSGRTTRMLGHTQARGQRKQARRDARN